MLDELNLPITLNERIGYSSLTNLFSRWIAELFIKRISCLRTIIDS